MSAALTSLMSRSGFQVTITRDKHKNGGKIGVEFAYLADAGSDSLDGFDDVDTALAAVLEAMEKRDDERH